MKSVGEVMASGDLQGVLSKSVAKLETNLRHGSDRRAQTPDDVLVLSMS